MCGVIYGYLKPTCFYTADQVIAFTKSVFVAPGWLLTGDQFMLHRTVYCSVGVGSPPAPLAKREQRLVALQQVRN